MRERGDTGRRGLMGQYSEEDGKRGQIEGKTGERMSCQVFVIIF